MGRFECDKEKKVCFNGIFSTTREKIRKHPIDYYKRLAKEVNAAQNTEVIHFMERAAGSIFLDDASPFDCIAASSEMALLISLPIVIILLSALAAWLFVLAKKTARPA